MTNSFRARSTLKVGDRSYEIWSLAALPQDKLARLPFSLKILLENLLRFEDGVSVTRTDIEALLAVGSDGDARPRDRLHARARHSAGLHRRALRGGPGRDARCHRAPRRQCRARQPAQPRGAGHRSLGAGRRIRHLRRARRQHRHRIRPQPRALRLPALGPDGVQQSRGGAAEHRHRAPGQPRVSRPGDFRRRVRRHAPRLPRHAGRHRLAHHHDQRAGRARLGRGRHRGRGRDARPAGDHAHPAGRRLSPRGTAAARRHRDRPGAHRHRDAAQEGRGGQVRRVLRRRPRQPAARRPRHDRQHGAGIRQHLRHLPHRCGDGALPRAHRAARASAWSWSAPTPRHRACGATRARTPARYTDELELELGKVEPSLAGPAPPAGSRAAASPRSRCTRRTRKRPPTSAAHATRAPAAWPPRSSTGTASSSRTARC